MVFVQMARNIRYATEKQIMLGQFDRIKKKISSHWHHSNTSVVDNFRIDFPGLGSLPI